MQFRHLAAASVLASWVAASAAGACTGVTSPNVLCTPASNPCFVDGKQCTVPSGTTLDFGNRDVVFRQGSRLDVGSGTMTIRAASLVLQHGTALLGDGGQITVLATGNISVLKSGTTNARIDVADPVAGGAIWLVSQSGAIEVVGIVDARGTNIDGGGGTIDMDASTITISGDVLASGGLQGDGGSITLDTLNTMSISGKVEGSGGYSGASLDITAGDSIISTGRLDVRATRAGGLGGFLTILSTGGSITLGGNIFVQGDEGSDLDGGGDGGDLFVSAAGALTIGAAIDASGARPDGQGGDVQFLSVLDLAQTGFIQVQGKGELAAGGALSFDSEHSITLGDIDAHGGASLQDSGGIVEAQAWCDVFVPSGVLIIAEGGGGSISLRTGRQLIAAGRLRAGAPIVLQYQALTPIVTGGSFIPEVDFLFDPELIPCGGVPLPGCGDDTILPPEECDDGNTTQCDGCSSACTNETCGNGTVDCGEICDDGNTQDGDGCHGDCARFDVVCGDGITDAPEECDDVNLTTCDGCSDDCRLEACGNGVTECEEECDPPSADCRDQCLTYVPPGCGNGVKADAEECDDANVADGDGCSHQCRREICGNGIVDPGEDCDDLNTDGCDDCSPTCKAETCGNGVIDCGEECDDGDDNGLPGSRCLPIECRTAPVCSVGGTSPCVPCASAIDCDPANGVCEGFSCNAEGHCEEGTPPACNDGNTCNGTETCAPATGCVAGIAPVCDGPDQCVVHGCDASLGCTADPLRGFSLMRCRLGVARDLVNAAPAAALATSARRKLLKGLGGVEQKLVVAESNPRKTVKSLRAAAKRVLAAQRFVIKQRSKQIDPETADALLEALGALPPALVPPA